VGYWTWYAATIFLAYATQHPAVALVAVVIYFARPWLPDPVVWIRTMGRMSKLKGDIALNPANMVATRDLARLYLERLRPRKAIELIEHTRQRMAQSTRHPQGSRDDAELLYYLGLARYKAGKPAEALEPLVAAVAIAPDVGRGDPYMIAANALSDLGRWEEAEDSLDRFLDQNQSSIEVYVKLARVRSRQKNAEGAREAIAQAKQTWSVLPSFVRRHQWRWWLAAMVSFAWL
jgi:tetratricopeptide (TPR) repeat protein